MSEGGNITGVLEPVFHGGALDAVRAAHPEVVEPWIDLSTGISPISFPVAEFDPSVWSRLPLEQSMRALLASAAKRYGASSPEHVVAAGGTQAIIQVLPRLLPHKSVVIVGPTYEEHARSWTRGGGDVLVVDDLDTGLRTRPDVLVVVNPNNPTGRVYTGDRLLSAARELESRNGLLVVDEAFCDLLDEGVSLVPMLPENAIVLRSFGKTYGLAGARLGFAISLVDVALNLRAELGPWAVSGPAIELGRRALEDGAWLEALRSQLVGDCARLRDLLVASGFSIVGHTPLFVLGSIVAAASVRDRLANAGIHVRYFPQQPSWLRFGIPADESEWLRLSGALSATTRNGKTEA